MVTKNPYFIAEGTLVTHSIEEALIIARENGEEEAFIIGGAQIYEQSLSLLDKIYLTEIDIDVPDGDAYFPTLNDDWIMSSEDVHPTDERNKFPYVFRIFEKKKPRTILQQE